MDKTKIKEREAEIIRLTRDFCDKHLDREIAKLAKEMVLRLGRKRVVPFERGRVEIWAAAVIHALMYCNFLYDDSVKPHTSNEEISQFFGTMPATITNKSKVIRDMLAMEPLLGNFTTKFVKSICPYRNGR